MITIVTDADFTFFDDFGIEDRKNHAAEYSSCITWPIIKLVYDISTKVNSLGIIGNTKNVNDIRFHLFDAIALRRYSNDAIIRFGKFYEQYSKHRIEEKMKDIDLLKSLHMKLIIATNNPYICKQSDLDIRIVSGSKKDEFMHIALENKKDRIFYVGDNLHDDILPANSLKKHFANVKTIYLGKSVFAFKSFCNYRFKNWHEMILSIIS